MEEDLKKLRCGQCSQSKHEMYLRPNQEVIAVCTECKSASEIKTTNPKVVINHLSGDGTLCVY